MLTTCPQPFQPFTAIYLKIKCHFTSKARALKTLQDAEEIIYFVFMFVF